MVTTESTDTRYLTIASNGREKIELDAPIAKGGTGRDFGPHELLEAALAACLNMAVRMHADAHLLPLESVSAKVHLVRPAVGPVCYEYGIDIRGSLTDGQRNALMAVAEQCPVRQTLLRPIEFRLLPSAHLP